MPYGHQQPDLEEITYLIEEYTDNFDTSQPNDRVVSVQFHDQPDRLGELVGDLVDMRYNIKVDQVFEAPPQLSIGDKIKH